MFNKMINKICDEVMGKLDIDRDDDAARLFITIVFWGFSAIAVLIALKLVMALYVTTLTIRMEHYRSVCLTAGYTDIKITYDYDLYCVTRLDQADVVVPIDDVAKPE